jgi:LacI family transcriptional regulator
MTRQSGYRSAAQLLAMSPRPTAIVAGNDLMAIGVMQLAQEMGLHIGPELAVTGFDDIPQAGFATPPLTTLRQPIYEIGRTVTRMLIDRLNGVAESRPQRLLEPELIVRASSTGYGQDE